MPYIVTGGLHPSYVGTGALNPTARRSAVATLSEARDEAAASVQVREGDYGAPPPGDWDGCFARARALPESGGTVEMPDGDLVEVRRVSWPELGELAGRTYRFAEYNQTIDAFNEGEWRRRGEE